MKALKLLFAITLVFPFMSYSLENTKLSSNSFTPKLPLQEIKSKEKAGYWYASGGAIVTIPKATIGYRFQKEKRGGDVSFTAAMYHPTRFASYGLQYSHLFYPAPHLEKQGYLGISTGTHYFIDKGEKGGKYLALSLGCLGGLQFQVGKRYHFIEARVGGPLLLVSQSLWEGAKPFFETKTWVPLPSISYGVSF